MLLGQVNISDEILLSSFSSLSSVECKLIKDCHSSTAQKFPSSLQDKQINLLARFGARIVPTPANLKSQLIQAANFIFLVKPIGAILAINGGINISECEFWRSMSVKHENSAIIIDPQFIVQEFVSYTCSCIRIDGRARIYEPW